MTYKTNTSICFSMPEKCQFVFQGYRYARARTHTRNYTYSKKHEHIIRKKVLFILSTQGTLMLPYPALIAPQNGNVFRIAFAFQILQAMALEKSFAPENLKQV